MISIIEILALIFIILVGLKITIVLINPRFWIEQVVKKIWAKQATMIIFSLIAAGVSLYFLLEELSMSQILAVALFISLLMMAGVAMYSQDFIKLAEKLYEKKAITKKTLPYIAIWIALILWGLKEIFF
ncbi:MAG: hypothetical protein AABX16_05700 [Nanoarchaeota archaeon]